MANMFNQKNEHMTHNENNTVIGEAVRLEGTFSGDDNMTIYGQVVGNLITSGDLVVAETAVIEAEVEAHNISVSGTVNGNITAKGKLELTASARIIGNVVADVLSVETGAVLEGTCSTGHRNTDVETPSVVESEEETEA